MIKIIWEKSECAIFGPCLNLTGLQKDESGMVRLSGEPNSKTPRYVAMAFINGQFMLHRASTADRARCALERDIERRSNLHF